MCKVLTQDKSKLIDVSNADIYIEKLGGQNIFNISIYRFNRSVTLGTYRTEEDAKRILEIMTCWLGGNGYYKMPKIDDSPITNLAEGTNI